MIGISRSGPATKSGAEGSFD